MGVYTNGSNNLPANLVSGSDTGSLTIASGFNSSGTLNVSLSANTTYWLAMTADTGSPLFNGPASHSALYCCQGNCGSSLSNSLVGQMPGVAASRTYGAMPSTFPTSPLNDQSQPAVIMGF